MEGFDFFKLLEMIGGLALFLYGMNTMGDALSKLAGGKLEKILENMTNNPIKAVLLGAGVTAVIQSSSATTVMVVGFVNSGIMKLSQAIGVIMGANIGTTITSWILSLTGIEGDNFFIQILKPSSFTPILAVIGIILLMFVKNVKKNDIGVIFLGFAVLMFGMETMSGAVKPLANVPEFTSLFTAFENPFLGMLVGALLTAIIQSSSASVGILQAMCATGSVTMGAAIPVIMGQNIGTCITALISGIGANKNAKRASLVHLYFNVIGTVLFMVLFYTANAFIHFEFLSGAASAASIAVVHSVFNVSATAVLLPLSKVIEKLAYLSIPVTEDEKLIGQSESEVTILDERFLEKPAFAVAQCKNAVYDMARYVSEAMSLVYKSAETYNQQEIDRIFEIEDILDKQEDEISSYISRLYSKSLSERDTRLINKFVRCITDYERISDYVKSIAFTFTKMEQDGEQFSEKATAEKMLVFKASYEIVENTVNCFLNDDTSQAFHIEPLEEVIAELRAKVRKNHNKRLAQGKCSVELGMSLNDILTSLGRIAGHCSNIAEEVIVDKTEGHALHSYAKDVRENSAEYKNMIENYRKQFFVEED